MSKIKKIFTVIKNKAVAKRLIQAGKTYFKRK